MPAGVKITETDLLTALRGFLIAVAGDTYEVIKGQDNQVATPIGRFIVMTSMLTPELNKPYSTFTDNGANAAGEEHTHQAREWICQIDVYGDQAAAMATAIATMTRSSWGARKFSELTKKSGFTISPLYADVPHQTTMINGERQYEARWTVDLHLQFNQVISTDMQFADQLYVNPVSVDAEFPPEKL
ncbi:phage neck terminator protein [Klebsiella quasivariicola]|uniref:phage neck terminator protein n=1 Tax=Klebsiella quasivariicola TaxID=2026240 RepID=UPI00247A9288|nr:hypothetical protein [Klebsiella quasivariicola]